MFAMVYWSSTQQDIIIMTNKIQANLKFEMCGWQEYYQ